MPVPATCVSSSAAVPPPPRSAGVEDYALSNLSTYEREYVRGLRKRDRVGVVRLIADRKRGRGGEAPLRIRVLQSQLPEGVRVQIFDKLQSGACGKYVEWVQKALRLPLGRMHPPHEPPHMPLAVAIARAKATMDASIAGHDVAKREVLKLVAQTHGGGAAGAGAYALGLEGPPGTGKTHFVRTALARALGRPLVSIPLGGAGDLSYLFGSVYTYEGSKEGRLAGALLEAGCCNPIVHLDEVDKISTTDRGQEVASALIHLVDPSANAQLRDRYFHDIDLDFSKCTFVFSYNDPSRVHPILLDRIKRVSVASPTDAERAAIVTEHLVPRARVRLGTSLGLADETVALLLRRAAEAPGSGMRGTEKEVDHVLGAAALCDACGERDGALAGAPGVPLLVADGKTSEARGVGAAFATRCLATLDAPRGRDAPPTGMYT
jgi:hypothetical protein